MWRWEVSWSLVLSVPTWSRLAPASLPCLEVPWTPARHSAPRMVLHGGGLPARSGEGPSLASSMDRPNAPGFSPLGRL